MPKIPHVETLKKVITIGRGFGGLLGFKKNVKVVGWAGSQSVIAGTLVELGLDIISAIALAGVINIGAGVLWNYLRTFEIPIDEIK